MKINHSFQINSLFKKRSWQHGVHNTQDDDKHNKKHNTIQHNTIQHNTIQHNTTQHNMC